MLTTVQQQSNDHGSACWRLAAGWPLAPINDAFVDLGGELIDDAVSLVF
jgi:hypothetical protein